MCYFLLLHATQAAHLPSFAGKGFQRQSQAGTTGDQLVSRTDVLATLAAITGAKLPPDAAEDSFSLLSVLDGTATAPVRPFLLVQGFSSARTLSLRRGPWKYIDHAGSGGNNDGSPELKPFALPQRAPDAPGQLYNPQHDPGETRNLYHDRPEIVEELRRLLDRAKGSGRSRP